MMEYIYVIKSISTLYDNIVFEVTRVEKDGPNGDDRVFTKALCDCGNIEKGYCGAGFAKERGDVFIDATNILIKINFLLQRVNDKKVINIKERFLNGKFPTKSEFRYMNELW